MESLGPGARGWPEMKPNGEAGATSKRLEDRHP